MTADYRRRSFKFCGETCPDVDRKFSESLVEIQKLVPDVLHRDLESLMDELCEAVKRFGTEKLRDALNDACSELIDAEDEAASLREKVSELESVA